MSIYTQNNSYIGIINNFIFRDIKPDNFLIGLGKKSNIIHMIDYGLAKRFIMKDGTHIPVPINLLLLKVYI